MFVREADPYTMILENRLITFIIKQVSYITIVRIAGLSSLSLNKRNINAVEIEYATRVTKDTASIE